MRDVSELALTEGEREAVRAWAGGRPERAVRAGIVLDAAAGVPVSESARTLGVSRPTVTAWRRRYAAHGLGGLEHRRRSGRPPRVDEADVVAATVAGPPGRERAWSARGLAGQLGVSHTTISAIWRRWTIAPGAVGGTITLPTVPAFGCHRAELLGVWATRDAAAVILSGAVHAEPRGARRAPACLLTGIAALPQASAAASPTVKGQVYAGYQGWFAAEGDGSPVDAWRHWSASTPPAPGNQSFEMYPDMRAYPDSARFQTGYSALGGGEPATLFSSFPTAVVDQHFQWMKDYGIDGAALQRFGSDITDPTHKEQRDAITAKARDAAEKHGRGFYVEYDVSGLTDENFEQVLTEDWTNTITGSMNLTDSPSYAKEDGKPVVELWGLGFPDRPGTADQALRVVEWFRSQGAYVIGGVPAGWRTGSDTKPGFEPVYHALDMVSPWAVGKIGGLAGQLAADRDDFGSRGQDYQPVIYPGFAWSNWNGGERNMIPRAGGDYLWQQAAAVREAGVGQAFIAMFDEYDEGTAIAPAAADSSMTPTDQYFLTTSADGKYVSPDFYLRLAGKATRMINGADPLSPNVPIPLAEGPVFFRSGVEKDTDAQPTWTDTPAPGGTENVTGPGGSGAPQLGTATGADHRNGESALRLQGSTPTAAHSYAYMQAFDVDIPVTRATKLSYGFLPKNDGGRHAAVDFVMTDGSTLRGSDATTTTGIDMHPGTPKGTVGEWTGIQSDFGPALDGKTIDTILVGYDREQATGGFDAYVDDLEISNG